MIVCLYETNSFNTLYAISQMIVLHLHIFSNYFFRIIYQHGMFCEANMSMEFPWWGINQWQIHYLPNFLFLNEFIIMMHRGSEKNNSNSVSLRGAYEGPMQPVTRIIFKANSRLDSWSAWADIAETLVPIWVWYLNWLSSGYFLIKLCRIIKRFKVISK